MRTTVSLDDDLAAHVDEIKPSDDSSDAEAVREAIRRSQRVAELEAQVEEKERELDNRIAEIEAEYATRIDGLERDLEHAEARNEDLQRQLAAANQRIDSANELVSAVETDMNYREKKAKAGILQRAKWWFTGMDDGDDTTDG